MADVREVFTTLEDATGEGISYLGKAPGAAQSTDEQAPVLPAVDLAGNLQNIPRRSPGDADSDGVPGFSFQDSSNNLIRPTLNAMGELPVALSGGGTANSASAEITVAALNTEEDVVVITLANNDVVSASMAMGGAFRSCVFVLYHDDNATLNELARFVVGAGDFQHTANLLNISFTAGS
jgi:hypothetical protein